MKIYSFLRLRKKYIILNYIKPSYINVRYVFISKNKNEYGTLYRI